MGVVQGNSLVPKILVLIIASDDDPVYIENQKIWRLYMHLDPSHIEAYFLKNKPDLLSDIEIDGDVIWVKGEETIKPGILHKTLAAIDLFLPRIQEEFSFVLRTNLSSFFSFPLLLDFLSQCPQRKLYTSGGLFPQHSSYLQKEYFPLGSGCGFIMSSDTAQLLIEQKNWFKDVSNQFNDDVCIGLYLSLSGIRCFETPRMDLWDSSDLRYPIPLDLFHFRIKHSNQNERVSKERYLFKKLLKKIYNIEYVYDFSTAI